MRTYVNAKMKIAQISVKVAKIKAYVTKPVANRAPLQEIDNTQMKMEACSTRVFVMLARYHMGEVIARYRSIVRMHRLRSEAVQHMK